MAGEAGTTLRYHTMFHHILETISSQTVFAAWIPVAQVPELSGKLQILSIIP